MFQLQKQKDEETKKEADNSKAYEEKLKKMKKKFTSKINSETFENNKKPDTKPEKLTEKNLKALEKEKSKPK